MLLLTLRKGDGIHDDRDWLRAPVRLLQKALAQTGVEIDTDGYFGSGTETILKQFQQEQKHEATGVCVLATWEALAGFVELAMGEQWDRIEKLMPTFHGDLDWIHHLEGHIGRAYWPGGKSGVTLDPGVDMGYVELPRLRNYYRDHLSSEQWEAINHVMGLRGQVAKAALDADEVLQGIHVQQELADEILPHAIKPYWDQINERFPVLNDEDIPPSVQTVLLSLAYNRGPNNSGLEVLREPLQEHRWEDTADLVSQMQQTHSLLGIRKRRRWEGALIRAELELAE